MPAQIALLRGVNVGGKLVAMAALRAMLERLGFGEVRSLLNSGNLVFRGDRRRGAALERLLEIETEKQLGLKTAFLVREAGEWNALVAGNPFPEEAVSDPGHLVLTVLRDAPSAAAAKALQAAIVGREIARVEGRAAYIVYPDGIGPSKLTLAVIERKLGTTGTARNWNTVLKLAALVQA